MELWKTLRFGHSIAYSIFGNLPMHKLVLAICLLSVAAPFATAQYGGTANSGQYVKQPQKHQGHAPEMSGTAMAIAGVIGLGGYLLIRRRLSWQH
jgi:hypothetical protein